MLSVRLQGSGCGRGDMRETAGKAFIRLVPIAPKPWALLAALLLWALLTANAWAGTRDCLASGLEVDTAMSKATLRVTARSTPKLNLQEWQASKRSRSDEHVYTLDISRSLLPEGRKYPLIIRLAPSTVAINLQPLINPDDSQFERLCGDIDPETSQLPASSPVTLFEGYAFFSDGRPIPVPTLLADQGVPQAFRSQYQDWLEKAQTFYRRALGPEPHSVSSVIFLLEQGANTQQGCRFSGSSLPGLLLIGLRAGCLDTSKGFPNDLSHFIAHEAFHQWNQDVQMMESLPQESRIMLLEGGAEMAASLFLSEVTGSKEQGITRDVGAAAESCIDQAEYKKRPLNDLISGGEYQLAYSCGMVYTFINLIRIDSDPAAALGAFWKSTLQDNSSSRFNGRTDFNEAFGARSPVQNAMIELLAQNGYALRETISGLSKDQQFRIAAELMREVSRNDCHGNYGLFTGGGVIVLDPEVKTCSSLRPGEKPVAVDGFDFREHVLEARSAWISACRNGGAVSIDYSDSSAKPSIVSCQSPPRSLYTPFHLSRITPRGQP